MGPYNFGCTESCVGSLESPLWYLLLTEAGLSRVVTGYPIVVQMTPASSGRKMVG